jgi:hypothetical protein
MGWDGVDWTYVAQDDGLLCTRYWNLGLHKSKDVCLVGQLLAS